MIRSFESADGSMATVANSAGRKILSNEKKHGTHLTPTGLLMEGHYTQNPANEWDGDLSTVTGALW
jgi:hypothetical protein